MVSFNVKRKPKILGALHVVLIGITMIFVGYHNLDQGWNMRWLKAEFGIELCDWNLGNNYCYGDRDAISMGYTFMLFGSVIFYLGGLLLGGSLNESKIDSALQKG